MIGQLVKFVKRLSVLTTGSSTRGIERHFAIANGPFGDDDIMKDDLGLVLSYANSVDTYSVFVHGKNAPIEIWSEYFEVL